MLTFQPMGAKEFLLFKKKCAKSYAQELRQSRRLSLAQAMALARASFKTHLPQGTKTPGHKVCLVRWKHKIVGHVWFAIKDEGDKAGPMAYLFDITIYPRFQGQGLGEQTMRLFEQQAKEAHAAVLGLHVFGHNERAQKLYRKLGFVAKNIVMVKKLKRVPKKSALKHQRR